MGSVTNSLNSLTAPVTASSSSSSSSSSSNPTGIFTGTSAYSQDFQNVINRQVAIASLPITLLTNQQTHLTNQSNELTTLDTLFTKLQSAIQSIGNAMSGSSFQAQYSTANVVTATLGNGAAEGVYSINVTNPGAYATSLTANTWNAAPGAGGGGSPYTLVAGSQEYTFTPTDNSAQTVASTINSKYGNLVHALAVNVGTTAVPDWRISLQSTTLGPANLDLIQMPSNATPASCLGTGAAATYSTSLTSATWNPAGGSFSLVVDGVSHAITTSDNSAQGVAAAINAQYGNLVQATVVNQGTSSAPDYRISLQSNTPNTASVLQITDSQAHNLQTTGGSVSEWTNQSRSWDPTADSQGSRSIYTLVVGSNQYTFAPSDNTAATLASTINAQFGSQVYATVLNGQISLRSATPGSSTPLDLQKATAVSYQKAQTPGQLAQYSVDGGGTVQSNSRAITVATGVTLTLQGTGSTSVTITRPTSALDTALSSFADAYNAVVDELAKQRGQSGGPLQGQSIVNQLAQTLSQISTYSSTSGQIAGLASLGLNLDVNGDGHLTYSETTLLAADFSNSSGVTDFLGSTSGGGFLKTANDAINNLEDPTKGLLKNTETNTTNQITSIGNQISTKQNQVYQLQTNLTSRMAAADALIASMEQQYSYLNSMFAAQQTANQSYK
jgi:flagellar capping protein FliD